MFPSNTPKRDVQEHLSEIETDMRRGQWANPSAGKETFKKYFEKWLKSGVESGNIRRTTQAKYSGLWTATSCRPGSMPLLKVRPEDVETWFLKLKAKHPATAADAYRLLATIFNSAKKAVPNRHAR